MSLLVVPIGKGLNCSHFNSPPKAKTRRTKTWLPYNFFQHAQISCIGYGKAEWRPGKHDQMSIEESHSNRLWSREHDQVLCITSLYYWKTIRTDSERMGNQKPRYMHVCLSDICTCRASFVRELMIIQFTFLSFKCWPPKNAYFFTNGHFYYTDILIIVWMKSCSVSCFSS